MTGSTTVETINMNPLAFEELATALATLGSYSNEGSQNPIDHYQVLYDHAMRHPLGFRDISELTGNSLDGSDRSAGRAAWLLLNTQRLRVIAVHSLVWHKIGGVHSAPVVQQVERQLGKAPAINQSRIEALGEDGHVVDVVGVRDEEIWVVQTTTSKSVLDSVVKRGVAGTRSLFKARVFERPTVAGKSLQALYSCYDLFRKAYPVTPVKPFVLVLHPSGCDFELYRVPVTIERPALIELADEKLIESNSLEFQTELEADTEALLMLRERVSDDTFRCVPPCPGGRTLALLASTARRQIEGASLLFWREQELRNLLRVDHGFEVTRDKVRHDLQDRLVGQGFMRKWESEYFLTLKGVARYLYCLAKYTTRGSANAMGVLDALKKHRNRLVEKFGCVL